MYRFDYHRPNSVSQARKLYGELYEPQYLAGGQSLIPMLKLRFSQADNIVDLRDLDELRGLTRQDDYIEIGAMNRHVDVATSNLLKETIPALAHLAGGIGDPLVRAQGTLGGSVANNDPSACYPSACLGLKAKILTTAGEFSADDFFTGVFETALPEGELITSIRFVIPEMSAYCKFRHPASRFALTGVFVAKYSDETRVAVTGAGSMGAYRWMDAETALDKDFSLAAVEGLSADISLMNSDLHGNESYRAHLVKVMMRRALTQLIDS